MRSLFGKRIAEKSAVLCATVSATSFVVSAFFIQWNIYFAGALFCAWVALQRRIAAGPSCKWQSREKGLLLSSKVAIVTGANSGIGYYTALRLAELGCKVIITCRTTEMVSQTAARMRREFVARKLSYARAGAPVVASLDVVEGYALELDNPASIRAVVSQFVASGLPLHILVNNAGMMVKELRFSKSNPALELHTAVNFLGPLLLTELLIPTLRASSGRVINVASEAHRVVDRYVVNAGDGSEVLAALRECNQSSNGAAGPLSGTASVSDAFLRYGTSKLCNIYYSHYVANVHGVSVCSLHPGVVATGFTKFLLPPPIKRVFDWASLFLLKTEEDGAETTVYCCTVGPEELQPLVCPQNEKKQSQSKYEKVSRYFVDCRDATRDRLRPVGWDVDAAVNTVKWGLSLMGL